MFTVKRLWILGASGGIFPTGVTMHTQAMAHEGTLVVLSTTYHCSEINKKLSYIAYTVQLAGDCNLGENAIHCY